MGNCLIAFNNRVDIGAIAGGSWLSSLPLSNLKNPVIGVVARSNSVAKVDTQFTVDLGVASYATRTVALVGHNLSLNAKVRIRSSDADPACLTNIVYDSGWQDAWPQVYVPETLPFEATNFWSGTYTDEERQGYNWNFMRSATQAFFGRYFLFEIDDTTNTLGYVQAGRVFIGEGWQPTINMEYGAGIGWEDPSIIDEAISGAEFYDRRPMYRVARFTIPNLTENEAFSKAFDLMRRAGQTREVLFQWNPNDTLHQLRRQYLGRLRQLSQIENPNVDANNATFEIKETL